MYFIFAPHLTSASALPGETGNTQIASFHLNAACFFTIKHETQSKYHLVRVEPPFTVKTIEWEHQTGPRKGVVVVVVVVVVGAAAGAGAAAAAVAVAAVDRRHSGLLDW